MQENNEHSEPMTTIPTRVFHVHLYVRNYFDEFWKHVWAGKNHREAWEAVEAELSKWGFPARYDSYESFRAGKTYHYSKDTPISYW